MSPLSLPIRAAIALAVAAPAALAQKANTWEIIGDAKVSGQ